MRGRILVTVVVLAFVVGFLWGVEHGKVWTLKKAYEVCRKVAPKGENPCSDN